MWNSDIIPRQFRQKSSLYIYTPIYYESWKKTNSCNYAKWLWKINSKEAGKCFISYRNVCWLLSHIRSGNNNGFKNGQVFFQVKCHKPQLPTRSPIPLKGCLLSINILSVGVTQIFSWSWKLGWLNEWLN